MDAAFIRHSPIHPTVDFEAPGVQHGFLKLPHSHDRSAWGAVMIPITVIKNGEGPTALLTGGNHGDEFEGPVALMDLSVSLELEEVSGRVIIVPAMNHPAFLASRRTSPIDGGNLNRSFPGDPAGTVTQKIADYFHRYLLPLADVVVDLHSGGKTLEFVPFAASHVLESKEQDQRCWAAVQAFSAPYSVKLLELDAVGMYDTAAEVLGKTFVSTELAGGGTTRAATNRIAKRGVRNVLIHEGIVKGEIDDQETQKLDMPDNDCYVISEGFGLLEPCVDLGEEVRKGDLVAKVYDTTRTGRAPLELPAVRDGILAGRHFPGLVTMGDAVAMIGVPA